MTETLQPIDSICQLGLWRAILVIINFKSYEDYGYLEPGQIQSDGIYPPKEDVFTKK